MKDREVRPEESGLIEGRNAVREGPPLTSCTRRGAARTIL